MSYLYLDTTHILRVGLLSKELNWVNFFECDKLKSSSIIHGKINEMLQENGLDIKELTSVIYAAGPGSYTGMRLSEGMAQIFRWQEMKTNSFYHFEVPEIIGIEEGYWFSEAFKGEFFCYSWDKRQAKKELINKGDFYKLLDNLEFKKNFTNSFIDAQEKHKLNSTDDLIKNNPQKLFEKVIAMNLEQPTMYYRSLELEFKVCK